MSLAGQKAVPGLQGKTRVPGLWKKLKAAQGWCEVVKGENEKGKSPVELHLVTAVKDNKNISVNTSASKGGSGTISIICWMRWK